MAGTERTFEDSRLDTMELLTLAQSTLIAASTDRSVTQSRAVRDTLSIISAARQELRKAEPAGLAVAS